MTGCNNEEQGRDFTLDELRLLKLAVTLAVDEVSRRKQPHDQLINQLDEMHQKLRNLGA